MHRQASSKYREHRKWACENCSAKESFRQSDISKWDAFFAEEPTLISTNKTESFLNIPGYQRCQHRDRPEWRSPFLLTESVTERANNREKLLISIYESWDNTDALDSAAQAHVNVCDRILLLFISCLHQRKNSSYGYWRTEIRWTFVR